MSRGLEPPPTPRLLRVVEVFLTRPSRCGYKMLQESWSVWLLTTRSVPMSTELEAMLEHWKQSRIWADLGIIADYARENLGDEALAEALEWMAGNKRFPFVWKDKFTWSYTEAWQTIKFDFELPIYLFDELGQPNGETLASYPTRMAAIRALGQALKMTTREMTA